MPDYIFDTTTLSNFALTANMDLLESRYRGVAFTTMEVTDELRRGGKAATHILSPFFNGLKPSVLRGGFES